MINAIAVDDEPPALKVIENFCRNFDFIELQKTFSQATESLKYLKKFPVDLIFLDIQMPYISGLDFYKLVKQDTLVIFTTAYSEYAVEGFNLQAIDFLLKPFTLDRFKQAVVKAYEYYNFVHNKDNLSEKYIFVRADYSLVKIFLPDINYIEGFDDYLKIHFENKKTLLVRMTMKTILEKLSPKEFIRIHRSFIVPFSKIESVRNKTVKIKDNELPIGISYQDNIQNLLKNLNII